MTPPWLRETAGGVELAVRLQPRARREEIVGACGGELKIKVTAPPVDSAANAALVHLLADTLGCPRGAVRLVRGRSSRHKTLWVSGVTAGDVAEKLAGVTGK